MSREDGCICSGFKTKTKNIYLVGFHEYTRHTCLPNAALGSKQVGRPLAVHLLEPKTARPLRGHRNW